MSTTDHPFERERVETVADESGLEADQLEEALTSVQRAIARDADDSNAEYEYSSQHNFGWADDDAFYLHGDGIWGTLADELSLSEDLASAAREVHRRTMLDAAEESDDRTERETVEEMFSDGTEPLVVTNTGREPPLFGQDV